MNTINYLLSLAIFAGAFTLLGFLCGKVHAWTRVKKELDEKDRYIETLRGLLALHVCNPAGKLEDVILVAEQLKRSGVKFSDNCPLPKLNYSAIPVIPPLIPPKTNTSEDYRTNQA